MGIKDDWARRGQTEVRSEDLGIQAGRSFLSYITTGGSRPEKLAAVSTAASMLGWALASATVEADGVDISPQWLRDVGRDLITRGESLSRIVTGGDRLRLLRQSSWSWTHGTADPHSWVVQATETGPHETSTRDLPWSAVVRVEWATDPSSPWVGRPAADTASTTADLAVNVETALSREAAGDVGRILPVPAGGEGADSTTAAGDDQIIDPMEGVRDDIASAKGRTLIVESTSNNYDLGGKAPKDDWEPRRIGPDPAAGEVTLATDAHQRLLNALCVPLGLITDSDGTSQREGLRRWHMGVVVPISRLIAHELVVKLERPVKLRFDPYALDMATRVGQVAKLAGLPGVDVATAAAVCGVEGLEHVVMTAVEQQTAETAAGS